MKTEHFDAHERKNTFNAGLTIGMIIGFAIASILIAIVLNY